MVVKARIVFMLVYIHVASLVKRRTYGDMTILKRTSLAQRSCWRRIPELEPPGDVVLSPIFQVHVDCYWHLSRLFVRESSNSSYPCGSCIECRIAQMSLRSWPPCFYWCRVVMNCSGGYSIETSNSLWTAVGNLLGSKHPLCRSVCRFMYLSGTKDSLLHIGHKYWHMVLTLCLYMGTAEMGGWNWGE